jgi:hypothetical protein
MTELREDPELFNQLMELKALTELTSSLHELQVYQLKMYAALMFNENSNTPAEIQVNLDKPTVTFCVDLINQPDLNTLNGLARTIKSLLGEYFSIVVKDQDNIIFTSPGTKKPKLKQRLKNAPR